MASRPGAKSAHTRRRPVGGDLFPALQGYFEYTRRPWPSLLFILPLLIAHEWGVRHFSAGGVVEHRIAAFSLLIRFFNSCGAYNHHLPALAVVAILLTWHLARGDRWEFNSLRLGGMVVESLLLAIPLVGVFWLFSPRGLWVVPAGDWKLMTVLYLGAGVYEELLFRLVGMTVLWLVLIDLLRIRQVVAVPAVVFATAAAFAGYHTLGTGEFPWQSFVFCGLRGVYYGVLFLSRGFGLTIGTHVAYDMIYLALAGGLGG